MVTAVAYIISPIIIRCRGRPHYREKEILRLAERTKKKIIESSSLPS